MKSFDCGVTTPYQSYEPLPLIGSNSTTTAGSIKRMATTPHGPSTKRRLAKPPEQGCDVVGEAPFRVFRYAPASALHLTHYETKQNEPAPKDP